MSYKGLDLYSKSISNYFSIADLIDHIDIIKKVLGLYQSSTKQVSDGVHKYMGVQYLSRTTGLKQHLGTGLNKELTLHNVQLGYSFFKLY